MLLGCCENRAQIFTKSAILIKHPVEFFKRLLSWNVNIEHNLFFCADTWSIQNARIFKLNFTPIYTFNLKNLPPLPFMNSILLFVLNESKYTIWASWESCKFKRKWSFVNISLFFSNTACTLFYCPHWYNESYEEATCICFPVSEN